MVLVRNGNVWLSIYICPICVGLGLPFGGCGHLRISGTAGFYDGIERAVEEFLEEEGR